MTITPSPAPSPRRHSLCRSTCCPLQAADETVGEAATFPAPRAENPGGQGHLSQGRLEVKLEANVRMGSQGSFRRKSARAPAPAHAGAQSAMETLQAITQVPASSLLPTALAGPQSERNASIGVRANARPVPLCGCCTPAFCALLAASLSTPQRSGRVAFSPGPWLTAHQWGQAGLLLMAHLSASVCPSFHWSV